MPVTHSKPIAPIAKATGKSVLEVVVAAPGGDEGELCCVWRQGWSGRASTCWPRRSSRALRNTVWCRPRPRLNSITGKGVVSRVEGREMALGNAALMQDLGVDAEPPRAEVEARQAEGQTVMLAVIDKCPAGPIAVAGPVEETTPSSIEILHREGVRAVMLTGDC